MIRELRERKHLTQGQLAEKVGLKYQSVQKWEGGRGMPTSKQLSVVAEVLGVSVEELLRGKKMHQIADEPGVYVTGNIKSVQSAIPEFYTQVPFLSIKAQAGVSKLTYEYCDLRWIDETYPVFMPIITINERHIVIEIDGDSMEPGIRSGALVLAENINGNDWEYESGGVFAVLYGPGRFVVKRIRTNDISTEKVLRLHSDNDLHGIITVPAEQIHCMWKVIRKVDEAIR